MADVKPNYSLEIQGLELEMSQLEHNIKSQQYRIAQMDDEKARIETNIDATHFSISSLTDKIKSLKGK